MRRFLKRSILVVVAAALANVASAWAIAFWGEVSLQPPVSTFAHADSPRWKVRVHSGLGVTAVNLETEAGPGQPYSMSGSEMIPMWSEAHERPTASQHDDANWPWISEYAYGWPLRSMVTRKWKHIQPVATVNSRAFEPLSGWRVGDTGVLESMPYRLLPLQPLPLGFLLNTLLYAVVLSSVLFAPGAVRRWLRKRRGLCVACAYPVTEGTCSECGSSLP